MAEPDFLTETLRQAQRLGFFGGGPIEAAIDHATHFVAAIGPLAPGARIIDLGSGGGLPGLVVADCYRDSIVVLLDRRQKRTDFLERAVARLGFAHVAVWCADASSVAAEVSSGRMPPFDVVTARGFGPPAATLRLAVRCVGAGGRVVISEPPTGDRWDAGLLDEVGVDSHRHEAVRSFTRRTVEGEERRPGGLLK